MPHAFTFDGLLASRCAQAGARPVFVTEDGDETSPAEFARMAGQAAAWLRAQGLGKGDVVAIWLPNHVAWMALLFGAARIGVIVAAVNTRYRTADLHHVLASSGAKLLIFGGRTAQADFRAMTGDLDFDTLPGLAGLAVVGADEMSPIHGIGVAACRFDDLDPLPEQGAAPDDPVMLFTTSGTTSKPKLVVHTQGSLSHHARNCITAYGFDIAQARYLATMPFCGVFGLNPTFSAITAGAPVYLMAAFRVGPAVDIARRAGITHFIGSDEMFRQMWEADRTAFARAHICGFGAFTPGLSSVLHAMATAGLPLAGVYGASEVNAIFSIQPRDCPVDQRLQGGGRPSAPDSVTVRVRNPDTGELCADNEPGVLEIRAPTNFAGYYRNPEATAKAVDAQGFFCSNDAGYLRGDGTFVYLARNGDFIRLSGFLTDPAEIEEVIESARDVAKAQVVGATLDGKTRPVAFVLPRDGATPDPDAILAHTRTRLAHYKVPVAVIPVTAFPTTESANGLKIQKTRLRDMAEAHLAKQADPS